MRRFRKSAPKKFTIEDFDRDGLKWPGKFFGRVPVQEKNGSAATQQAIKTAQEKIKTGMYNVAKKKVKVFIKVSIDGVYTLDLKNGKEITNNSVHRITAWYPDDKAKDTFGIVVKGEGGNSGVKDQYSCIVLKSPKAAATLSALKQLMEIVFESTTTEDYTTDAGAAGGGGSAPPPSSPLETLQAADPTAEGAWKCPDCPWVEHGHHVACMMCGSAKPSASAAPAVVPYQGDAGDTEMEDGGELILEDGDEDEEPIEAYVATHDEDISPDYENLPGRDQDYINMQNALADADPPADDAPDYMNMPDTGAGGYEDAWAAMAAKNSTEQAPAEHNGNGHATSGQTLTNPFTNPFLGDMSSDEEDDEDDVSVDFGALFNKKSTNPFA